MKIGRDPLEFAQLVLRPRPDERRAAQRQQQDAVVLAELPQELLDGPDFRRALDQQYLLEPGRLVAGVVERPEELREARRPVVGFDGADALALLPNGVGAVGRGPREADAVGAEQQP